MKIFSFAAPFIPGLLRCLIGLMLEEGRKYVNMGLAVGVTIGGDAAKIGKKTHLLVIMHVRLLHKLGLLDLMNRNRLKKGNFQEQRTEIIQDYMQNSFNVTYMQLITTRTLMSTSWMCEAVISAHRFL